ncbi:LpqB family beta-propeller domain-containing protein [Crossiella sp. CA-258035]|uniref:LpqB family beta-propeller domain-containing protein n=1 Tax=Crossiella sp. CA-258035 TaxID=2981138 RepID=UPI0024BCE847|nr:LpqB family beta-propeller domain-containing protein [Crossiella sp. CA-258035]WHT20407.1 LpqB family beta-propeller domain-containing protein [Crossiella sp. CA-258035]
MTRRLLALCAIGGVLLSTGCAAIPEYTAPKPISTASGDTTRTSAPAGPQGGEDPANLVRNFIGASGKPEGSRAEARQYLVPPLDKSWDANRQLTVIEDNFNTQVTTDGGVGDTQTVTVRGRRIGQLGTDNAFVPGQEPLDLELPVKVAKQKDGQWRIQEPPAEILVARTDMDANYKQVRLAFFDPSGTSIVRDARYLPLRPNNTLPQRTMELLIGGPSAALRNAVRSALPGGVNLDTNVTEDNHGAMSVNLTGLNEVSKEDRQLVAAQVVLSLQSVSNNRIKLQSDGVSMIPDKQEWRPGDVSKYEHNFTLSPETNYLAVVNGAVRYLPGGEPFPGPAGSGELSVVTAAQSPKGDRLAVVARSGDNVALRVGAPTALRQVSLPAGELTRPTWRPEGPELWTVADHSTVMRVVESGGVWKPQRVSADELTKLGPVTDLRLSRDGIRIAAVVDGRLLVGSVVKEGETTAIRAVRQVAAGALPNVVGVDWWQADQMVVATGGTSGQVLRVQADGQSWERFQSTNLSPGFTAITAAPGRNIVVADRRGLWQSQGPDELWSQVSPSLPFDVVPFYPG